MVQSLVAQADVGSSPPERARVPELAAGGFQIHWTTRDVLTVSLISSLGSLLTNPVCGVVHPSLWLPGVENFALTSFRPVSVPLALEKHCISLENRKCVCV